MRIQNVTIQNAEIVFPGQTDTAYAYRGTSPNQLAAIPEWERRYPEFSMWKELPAWGLYLRHADGITLDNVILRVEDNDYRPAIVADDVNNLTLRSTTIKEKEPTPPSNKKVQLIANNVTRLKKQHTTVATRQQKGTRDNLSNINASATTSDLITAHDNTTPCSEGTTLTHTTAQSKWRNGQGDVLHDLSDACRQGGLKMGVYISPWDRNAPTYGTPAYNETFRQTLQHALSHYGDIFEQWFDGANGEGPNGRKQQGLGHIETSTWIEK